MVDFLYEIIIIAVIAFFVIRYKKRIPTNAGRKVTSGTVKPSEIPARAAFNRPGDNTSVNVRIKDNIYNDWLARQLRDEEKSFREVSDMFQLKQDHINKCDAEFIKRFHENNCDAHGIDDGMKK